MTGRIRTREIDRKYKAFMPLKKYVPFLDLQISYHRESMEKYRSDEKSQGRFETHKLLRKKLLELKNLIQEECALCQRYYQRKPK